MVHSLNYCNYIIAKVLFVRMPLLYGSISGGRVLAVLFFICITFAGITSLISSIERPVHVLSDFGGEFDNCTILPLSLIHI